MATPTSLKSLVGEWTGSSSLNLGDWGGLHSSDSTLVLEAPHDGYAVVRITWSHEGVAQAGELIAAMNEDGEVRASWVDTWHQSGFPLPLTGTDFAVTGHYPAPEGPDWGWQISIRAEGETLALEMTNISPEGDEEWAVRCSYSRAQNI